jgi:hypothetical protein
MVTEHETNVPSEVDSSPEVTDSLPIDGDQPLVPADWDSQTEAEVATEEVATTGDETASDEAKPQPEETSDEVTAETEETTEATTTEEIAPAESESTEPRTYSDEEWGKRESSYRQRDSEQQKQVADLQASVAQMQQTYNDQLLNAEVRGYEQSLVKQLTDEGHDEPAAQRLASQQANAAKASYLAQQEASQLRQQLNQSTADQETTARNASVERMMQEHGVPEVHRELLQGYSDPALMVRAATALGESEKLKTETKAAKQAEVPNGAESGTFDSPAGAVSGMTDTQWLDAYSNDRLPDTTANDERAFKILSSRGMAPQF